MRQQRFFCVFTTLVILVTCFTVQGAGIAAPGVDLIPASQMTAYSAVSSSRTLIAAGDVWRFFKGQSEPPVEWTQVGFNDTAWFSGATGIGYGDAYSQYNRTVLTDMPNNYLAVYLRHSFSIVDPGAVAHIWLRIDYDDGFVAYLNGHEVARRNMGPAHSPVPYTMNALGFQNAGKPQTIDLTDCLTLLVEGNNVLAFQVHNVTISSSDLSITPELSVEEQPGDLADALLLKDPNASQSMDAKFRRLAGYYGLKYAAIDLLEHPLSVSDLLDSHGIPYPLIAVSEAALDWLDASELTLLRAALQTQTVTLLVYDLAAASSPAVEFLTSGEVIGSTQPVDSQLDWVISSSLPEVTREFSGQTLGGLSAYDQVDYALTFGVLPEHIIPLVQALDDTAQVYTLFASYQAGAGQVLLQGRNAQLELGIGAGYVPMRTLYTPRYLSEILPLMMAFRSTAGEEAWHRSQDTANLTIDDPYLGCDSTSGDCTWDYLNWQALLDEMRTHNFHTTIAMVAKNYLRSRPEVVTLFQQNPQNYSLALHGNNHDNGLPSPDNCPEFSPLISADNQELAIQEALWRMRQHQNLFGLPFDRVMVFPCNAAALVTFDLLKKYNFNVTANGVEIPMDATLVDTWDRRMGLAELAYNNFANVPRANTDDYPLDAYTYIFDLFRDQPVMVYTHASYDLPSLLAAGSDGFNPYADAINGLPGDVAWQSLEGIAESLYQEKRNDNGTMDVRMVGNHIRLDNPEAQVQAYQVRREENFAYVLHVLVDGVDMSYQVQNGQIIVQLTVPAHSSRDVLIAYNTGLMLNLPPGGMSVREGGVGEYTLRLISQPEEVVSVTLGSAGPIIVTPTTLVFTPENWELPQAVQVSAVDDGAGEPFVRTGVISHSLSSASRFFQGIQYQLSVTVNFRTFLPMVQGK